jgi:hypothetical protein
MFFLLGPLICYPECTPFLLAQFGSLLSYGLGRRYISGSPCQCRPCANASRSAFDNVFFFRCGSLICYPKRTPLLLACFDCLLSLPPLGRHCGSRDYRCGLSDSTNCYTTRAFRAGDDRSLNQEPPIVPQPDLR